MAKKKEENEVVETEVKASTSRSTTTSNKIKSTIKLRDADAKIRLMTKKGKRVSKTLEEWLMPSNFRLLTESAQNLITNGKTAIQIKDSLDN